MAKEHLKYYIVSTISVDQYKYYKQIKMTEEQLKYFKLTKVTELELSEGVWDAERGGLYSKDGKRFLKYKNSSKGPGNFTFKPGVEIICDEAFYGWGWQKGFTLPNTIVAIGDHALAHVMQSKERIIFPKSIKYFGYHIFGHSEGIFSVEFEEGIKKVDFGNVMDFAAATTVYIPSTLTSLGYNGFGKVNNTVSIHVAEGNKHFCIDNDVLYNYKKTILVRCPVSKRGILDVPEGVETIGKYAFRICGIDNDNSTYGVKKMSVHLPKTLLRIRKGAFRHSILDSLYIGANVRLIEKNAFEDHSIKEIVVASENPYFEIRNGKLIDKRTMQIIADKPFPL